MRRAVGSDFAIILILVLIAGFFRFYRLDELPIGLWRDEAANGLEALHVLEGDRPIFFGTREPMFIYFVAASVAFLGRNPLAIRVVAALAGTATIPVAYLLVKEIFKGADHRGRLVACLTGFWMATSYWHINFSRLGFRGALLPLFASLSFYFLWRGWNELQHDTSGWRSPLLWFAIAGLCVGLTFYTYTPARFLPLVLLPLIAQAARRDLAGIRRKYSADGSPRRAPSAVLMFAVFVVCFLLVFAPLGKHFLDHPGSFFVRSGISVFGAALDESVVVVLGRNTLRQLGMFGFLADPNIRHDPAGRPAFDLLTLLFFALGLVASLRRWRQTPYQFCLVWFFVMLLPAILTYPELPHYLRALGTLPVAYVFPALGVVTLWDWLRAKHTSSRRQAAYWALISFSLWVVASFTFRDYFAADVEELELVKAFDPRFAEIAYLMNDLAEPRSVWIIPVGPRDEQRMAYYVIDFLYQGEAPYQYVRVSEGTAADELTESCQGRERALLLQGTEDYLAQPWYDLYADSKGLLAFLLDKHSQRLDTIHFDRLDVLVYQLPEDPSFSFSLDARSTSADLGHGLSITGSAYGPSSADRPQACVLLRWQAETATSADFAAEVALMDDGVPAAKVDKLLLSGELRPTSQWERGQHEVDYCLAQCLPEAIRDSYSIQVSVYPTDVTNGLSAPAHAAEKGRSVVVGDVSRRAPDAR